MISPPLPWKAASINRTLHLLQIFYHLPHWNHALRQSQSLCLLLPNNKSNGKRLTAGCTILKSNSFLPSVAFLDTVANLSGHDILRAFLWDLLLNQMNTLTWEKLTTLNTLKSNYEPDCPKLHQCSNEEQQLHIWQSYDSNSIMWAQKTDTLWKQRTIA